MTTPDDQPTPAERSWGEPPAYDGVTDPAAPTAEAEQPEQEAAQPERAPEALAVPAETTPAQPEETAEEPLAEEPATQPAEAPVPPAVAQELAEEVAVEPSATTEPPAAVAAQAGEPEEPAAPEQAAQPEEPAAEAEPQEPAGEPEQAQEQPVAEEPLAEEPVVETVPVAGPEAAADEDEAQPEETGEAEGPVPAVPGRRPVALVVAVAVLAVLGAVLAVALWVWPHLPVGSSLNNDRSDATDAARAAARAVFSYDYRHLDKDFAAGKAVTTGAFRQEYERTTGKIIKDVAPRYKAVVVADVSDAGVVRAKPGRVVVLVYVDQQSTSSLVSGTKLTQSRLELTMVKRGGHWLVEEVRAF